MRKKFMYVLLAVAVFIGSVYAPINAAPLVYAYDDDDFEDEYEETDDWIYVGDDEKKPADAVKLSLDETVSSGSWYYFDISDYGELSVTYSHPKFSGAYDFLRLSFQKEGKSYMPLLFEEDLGTDACENAVTKTHSIYPGRFYIAINSTANSFLNSNSATDQFSFTLHFTKTGVREIEPNGDADAAMPVPLNTWIKGSLGDESEDSDFDYYSFTLKKKKTVTIKFKQDSAEESKFWDISVMNKTGTDFLVYKAIPAGFSGTRKMSVTLAPGTYLFRNGGICASTVRTGSYRFFISTKASDSTSVSKIVTKKITGKYHQTAARKMLKSINGFRTGSDAWYLNAAGEKVYVNDLSPLTYDYELEAIAMQRVAELKYLFSHTRPNGDVCFSLFSGAYAEKGENIAMGQKTANAAFLAWREDNENYEGQGHRRAMLSSDYTAVGIACFEYNGKKYWVQEFGSPNANPAKTKALNGKKTVVVEYFK